MTRLLVTAIFVLFLVGSVLGQTDGLYTIDHVDGLWNTDSLEVSTNLTFHIRMDNNTGSNVTGITNGFQIYSPDGAQWNTSSGALTGAITTAMFEQTFVNEFSASGTGADTIAFSGFRLFLPGIPAAFNEIVYTIGVGPISPTYHKKTLCIDSSYFPPAGAWKWSTTAGDQFPQFNGPHCFTIWDPSAPTTSNFILSSDSLHFTGTTGAGNPPSQSFQVSSDGTQIAFDLNEDADWIIPTPISGTTPRTISVAINNIGLGDGLHIDTIYVESIDADNSPQIVIVTLELIPPPPSIGVSPGQFFFNGVAGEANPADKFMTVSNAGGSTLNWTVANNSSWLSLSPTFGTDSGVVTLSVDITSLGFDDYYDTITVSDPAAPNDPILVPVSLFVGSDLPIIEIDTLFRLVTVPVPSTSIPNRTFTISNGGAGALSYWLEENSSRILTMTPETGSAEQQVTVAFKTNAGSDGDSYMDTLWVYSNEAVNSPVPVIFNLRLISNPAQIWVNKDTIEFTLYECDMGTTGEIPEEFVSIFNNGGDNPMIVQLLYESDYFQLSADSVEAPAVVLVSANYLDIPIGVYWDTIIVHAEKAPNSPDTIIVKYTMSAGVMTPQIVVSNFQFTISTQENSGPNPESVIGIENKWGGCMPWELQENIPWLVLTDSTGDVDGQAGFIVNSSGFPFGIYNDSMFVVAPSATNSPGKVTMKMKVWRFHGDWDYSGEISILDLVANVEYLFKGGVGPEPQFSVGNLNCDHTININDLTYFVEYMFKGGDIPCGNPY